MFGSWNDDILTRTKKKVGTMIITSNENENIYESNMNTRQRRAIIKGYT